MRRGFALAILVVVCGGILVIAAGVGCQSTSNQGRGDMIDTTGTVAYIDLEGGFYGINGDDGESYNPLELDASYREDGLRVRFTARPREDVMTIQMWGRSVEILKIEAL